METKHFPNGFDSWSETYFEIVCIVSSHLVNSEPNHRIEFIHNMSGRRGIQEYAEILTDEFEALNEGRIWTDDYLDAIDTFMNFQLS